MWKVIAPPRWPVYFWGWGKVSLPFHSVSLHLPFFTAWQSHRRGAENKWLTIQNRLVSMKGLITETQGSNLDWKEEIFQVLGLRHFFSSKWRHWSFKMLDDLQDLSSSAQTYWTQSVILMIMFTQCPSLAHHLWFSLGYIYWLQGFPTSQVLGTENEIGLSRITFEWCLCHTKALCSLRGMGCKIIP